MNQFRQGDVLIIEVNEDIGEVALVGKDNQNRNVLAYGEVTGHAHATYDDTTKLVDQKEPFGALYKIERGKAAGFIEDLQILKVKNRSPDPDGTFKDYYLMVPPECKTAHEAVAWTFGLTPEEYNPILET